MTKKILKIILLMPVLLVSLASTKLFCIDYELEIGKLNAQIKSLLSLANYRESLGKIATNTRRELSKIVDKRNRLLNEMVREKLAPKAKANGSKS